MKPQHPHRRSIRGFSVVETSVGGLVMAVVLGASMSVLRSGRDAFARGAVESAARAHATATLDAVAERLADCGASTASLANPDSAGGPYLTVQRCLGAAGNAVQWGPPITFGLEKCNDTSDLAAQGQTPAKSGQVCLWVGPSKTVLGSGLASNGLEIQLAGSMVTLTVTVERALKGGDPVRVSAVRKIHLAN